MDSPREKRKVALVLSGGGARGAYEVGVLKALRAHDIEPDVYCGTSVGSFNCAMAVAGKTIRSMEDVWIGLTSSGVFKLRLDPRQLLTFDPRPPLRFALNSAKVIGGILSESIRTGVAWWKLVDLDDIFVDTSPLSDLIRRHVDLYELRNSSKEIRIALTRLRPAGGDPLQIVGGKEINHRHILASCSLPFVFPQVHIGRDTYCDGGVVMNSPLKPAVDAGAEEIYIVDLTPPPRTYQRATLPLAYQVMSAGFSYALQADIKAAEELNDMYLAAHKLDRLVDDKLEITRLQAVPGKGRVVVSRLYRYLRVRVIRPEPDPRGIESFLDFDPKNAETLIEQGERDAEAALSRYYEMKVLSRRRNIKMALFRRATP